jgi:hypothetical protein
MPSPILSMMQWQTRVSDVYSTIRVCKMSYTDSLEYVEKHIYSELNRKHGKRAVYNAYIHGYVYGLMVAARNDIWRNHVEFCYKVDGVLYSTHSDSDKRKTEEFHSVGMGNVLSNAEGCHYWKGSDKPY